MENFEDKMIKHPRYAKYFRNFVTTYESKEEINLRGMDLKEKVKKEEFMPLSSMDYKAYEDDEDEKYNQEIFMKRKAEPSPLAMLINRKSSQSASSSEDENDENGEDSKVFGRKGSNGGPQSPLRDTQNRSSTPRPGIIQFELNSSPKALSEDEK